jgi:hypothetical protein
LRWSWIGFFLLIHLHAIRRRRAYKELFDKMAEDVGIMRRECEKI